MTAAPYQAGDPIGDPVRDQYEAFPYPARDPADEAKRLIEGSPSHLDELAHWVFAGRLPEGRPFRALVAGGGTGDGLVMLAQHLATRRVEAEVTYLDLSTASRAVAEARIEARGLGSFVHFATGALEDAARLAPGPWDYVDCCGVLHHLASPEAGIAALAAQLSPDGGMGVMVYAPYGRSGVYPLQSALRRLRGDRPPAEQVALARKLIETLPPSNLFRRNPLLHDHRGQDAEVYDLLLHSRDRPYTVTELADLAAGAGLAVAGFPEAARYDPRLYLREEAARAAARRLPPLEQAALAEELAGNMRTHVAYLVPQARLGSTVAPFEEDAVPVLRGLDGPGLAARMRPGQDLTATFDGLKIPFPLPGLAGALLARIDGRSPASRIVRDVASETRTDRAQVLSQLRQLAETLVGINKLHLRRP